MRAFPFAALACAAFLSTACSGGADEDDAADSGTGALTRERGAAIASATGADAASDALDGATPNEERVATLGLLNKRNNLSQDIELSPGESVEVGPVIVTLATCERTPPWEMPPETGAFVQVDVLERGQSEHSRIFSGWLFRQSPSLNVVEHPIYDVWVKDCAMRFPGEDASPDSEG